MSKPKRDITLGEMQDECKRVGYDCSLCNHNIKSACDQFTDDCDDFNIPMEWDLTDPPRFTEAQMALLKALWDLGVKTITHSGVLVDMTGKDGYYLGNFAYGRIALKIDEGETLDLAELFGKEGK